MKFCVKCECIYPDYHKECPVCGYEKFKKWIKAPMNEEEKKRILFEENKESKVDHFNEEEIEIDYDVFYQD